MTKNNSLSPNLFLGKNVIIQGISGHQGSLHTKNMLDYKTNIIAGTSMSKADSSIYNIPIFKTIKDIKKLYPTIDISIIFVPAKHAKKAIFEAIDNEIPLIITITEGIPIHDMLAIKSKLDHSKSILIGPNCPGILLPNIQSLGIIPVDIAKKGSAAIVSRSGTLTYELIDNLTRNNIGQKYIIGIGGDMIRGTNFIDCLKLFESDSEVDKIILIGEIGGLDEIKASEYIKKYISKPVYAYITGHHAPKGVSMGHAGAILGTNDKETAQYKTKVLADSGVTTSTSIQDLINKIT